ncbi:hypothetical protein ETAA8_70370 [Anatilimnocola aggregata]|uniref:TerB family tellurite resistance protein n=1 Tax=Anatilimnocola aggregata TaxID=2528021 RepID=A0A517YNT6_9BACT|nr:hypothetical protein [Anatilimnocola aggregata]QDU31876.1 hypothetical protein ETAA8_70370 [Anatilimnocola aggregata]
MADENSVSLAALDEYFAQQDPQLQAHVRQTIGQQSPTSALSAVSGIQDEVLLQELIAAGIRPETFACLSLLPLVEIAWSDGDVSNKERDAVVAAATNHGIESGSASRALLEHWLTVRPEVRVVQAWKEYIAILCKKLPPERAKNLCDEILGRARSIAATSGGILGLGQKVSLMEQFALDELEHAFRG